MSCAAVGEGEAGQVQEVDVDDSAGFSYVKRVTRGKRKARKGKRSGEEDSVEDTVKHRIAIIERRRQELKHDAGLTAFLDRIIGKAADATIDKKRNGLALGLGSLKDSRSAQVQLAFFLDVCVRLQIDRKEAFDPISDVHDVRILDHFGVTSLEANLRGAHTLDKHTFVFMPHCAKALYENFLRANWSYERLAMTLLCCNELERYLSGTHRREADEGKAVCIQRSVKRFLVESIPSSASTTTTTTNNDFDHALSEIAFQSFIPIPRWLEGDCSFDEEANTDEAFWTLPTDKMEEVRDAEVM